MAPSLSKLSLAAATAFLSLQTNAYKLKGYKGPNCKGEVQQTIKNHIYGETCLYFDDKVSSIEVVGGGKDYQWIFFNNYPCSKDTQVGSFLGPGCLTMGETKLKAVSNVVVEGGGGKFDGHEVDSAIVVGRDPVEKREVDVEEEPEVDAVEAREVEGLEKRKSAGIVRSWQNKHCHGAPTNEEEFPGENLPVTLDDVKSVMVTGVPSDDTAFACSDSDCHVKHQVARLPNGVCKNVAGKNVQSAMAIGPPTPPRSLINEARHWVRANRPAKRASHITCAKGGKLPKYRDALKAGDDWQGDNGLSCCCHIPGGPDSMTVGTATASLSDNIRCPGDPGGSKPPPSSCPMNCNEMRSYVYAIATECKNKDGKTGGTYHLGADQKIHVYHS